MRKGRWQPGALENGGPQMSSRRQWPGLGSQPPLLQSHLPPRRSNRVLSWTPGRPGRASVASGCDHETMLWPRRHERKLQTVLNLRTLCLAKSAVLIPSLWAGRQICDDSATWEGWEAQRQCVDKRHLGGLTGGCWIITWERRHSVSPKHHRIWVSLLVP